MNNNEIRNLLVRKGIKHWQLAEMLGIADTTLCRKLRKELTAQEKKHILRIIKDFD